MGPYITCHYNHPFQWSQSVPFDRQEVWSRRQPELSWNQDMVDPSSLIPEPMLLSTTHIGTQKILIIHINVFSLCWIETSSTKIFYFPSWPLFYCSLYTTPLEHVSYILMTCWLNSLSLLDYKLPHYSIVIFRLLAPSTAFYTNIHCLFNETCNQLDTLSLYS